MHFFFNSHILNCGSNITAPLLIFSSLLSAVLSTPIPTHKHTPLSPTCLPISFPPSLPAYLPVTACLSPLYRLHVCLSVHPLAHLILSQFPPASRVRTSVCQSVCYTLPSLPSSSPRVTLPHQAESSHLLYESRFPWNRCIDFCTQCHPHLCHK